MLHPTLPIISMHVAGRSSLQAIIAAPGRQAAVISDAPALAWQDTTHRAFPESFRATTRALLLCWQRLGREGGCSSPRGGAPVPNLGSLPLDVVSTQY